MEQFRTGLRLSPPKSEWVQSDPIASDAESAKEFFWRNRNFRRRICRGLGGLNLFCGSPPRTRADPWRIGGTSTAEMTEKLPPASATGRVRELPLQTFPKVRASGTILPGRLLIPTCQGLGSRLGLWLTLTLTLTLTGS